MPAFNEAEGLPEFLHELNARIENPCCFCIVDDNSTDLTTEQLQVCQDSGLPVSWIVNESNRGHGPSTISAWRLGLGQDCDVVVAVDGDGQFRGSDVNELIGAVISSGADVGEGVRQCREDVWFRRATSLGTRFLVWSRCRQWPKDANTPLRVYRSAVLDGLLQDIPEDSLTPNLLVSVLTRRRKLHLVEFPVASIDRRGSTKQGSTWGASRRFLPTRRYVTFCRRAAIQWFKALP